MKSKRSTEKGIDFANAVSALSAQQGPLKLNKTAIIRYKNKALG